MAYHDGTALPGQGGLVGGISTEERKCYLAGY